MSNDEVEEKATNPFDILGLKLANNPFSWLLDLLKPILNIFHSPLSSLLFNEGKGPDMKQQLFEGLKKILQSLVEKPANTD